MSKEICKEEKNRKKQTKSSHRVLRLGLHARQGRIGIEEMRKHPPL